MYRRDHLKRALFVMLLVLGWGVAGPVASESLETEPKEQIDLGSRLHITSDAVESDHRMGWIEFTGNARATQEDVVITADRIRIFYALDDDTSAETPTVEKVVSQGNVKIVFDNDTKTAVAEQAVYTADQKVLVLSGGGTTLWSGKDIIRGEKITVFEAEDRTLVEGGDKKQVDATFFTEGKEDGLVESQD